METCFGLWTSKRWQCGTSRSVGCCILQTELTTEVSSLRHPKPVCRVGVGCSDRGRYSIASQFFRRVQKQLHRFLQKDLKKVFSFFPEIFGPMWYLPMKTTWVHLCISWVCSLREEEFQLSVIPETSFSIACTCLYKHRKVGLRQHHRQSFLSVRLCTALNTALRMWC